MDKLPSEKRRYIGSVVRGEDTSLTVPMDIAEQGSGTDSPQKEETPPAKQSTRRRSARDPSWWEKNRGEARKVIWGALGSVVAAAIIGFGSWILYGVNRDVAQLQQGAKDTARRLDDMQKSANRVEDRLLDEQSRLRKRLEELGDRMGRPQPKAK